MAETDAVESDGLGDWPSWDSLESAVWDLSTLRRLAGALQALMSIAITLVLLGGTPVLLMQWGGWPLTDLPWLEEIESLPLTEETHQLILVLGGAAAWGSWAAFAAGVLGQVAVRLRKTGRAASSPSIEGQREGGRPLARRLVESAASGLSTLRSPNRLSASPPPATDSLAQRVRRARLPTLQPPPLSDTADDEGLVTAFADALSDRPASDRQDEAEETPQTASESEDPDDRPEVAGERSSSGDLTSAATPASDAEEKHPDDESLDEETPDEDAKEDEQPSRTMTAVVSSAGHLTLSPWRIGVGTRWSGTRVTVIQTGLHVKIYDPEDRLIRELEVDPDRRYQPSGKSPGPQRQ